MEADTHCLQLVAALFVIVSLSSFGHAQQPDSPYADCDTNFTTLERALFESGHNHFQILSTFFPARESAVLYAHVYYHFCEHNTTSNELFNCTGPELWWWTTGSFYFIQSPAVLRFTSLFFVYPQGHIGEVSISLPNECKNVSRIRVGHGKGRKEGMLEILTQRLKLYAQYNGLETIVTAEDTGFFAKAVPANGTAYELYGKLPGKEYKPIMFYILNCVLPFVMVAMFVATYYSSRVVLRIAFTNPRWYATFSALVAIGVCFSLFVVAMDICALVWAFEPDKYNEWQEVRNNPLDVGGFDFLIAIVYLDIWFVIIGLLMLVGASIVWFRRKEVNPEEQARCMTLLCFSFIGPLGCLGTHGGYMIVGWLTDPHHGGAVFIIYALSFMYYYALGKLVYQLCENRRLKIGPQAESSGRVHMAMEFRDNICNKRTFSFLTLLLVIAIMILSAGFKAFVIAAFAELPLVGLVENAPQYLLSLFQISVLIATVVLTYKYLTADTSIERDLVLGVIDNVQYLRQQERQERPQHQQLLLQLLQQQQQLLWLLQQNPRGGGLGGIRDAEVEVERREERGQREEVAEEDRDEEQEEEEEEEEGGCMQLLYHCAQRRGQGQPQGGRGIGGGGRGGEGGGGGGGGVGERRLSRPRTDTEVQKAAAILGAIGHKYLFESLPAGDQSTLDFLDRNEHDHYDLHQSPREYIQGMLRQSNARGRFRNRYAELRELPN